MATSPTSAAELYPFSTQGATAIPLEIIRPTGIIQKAFTTTSSSLTFPGDMQLAAFYSAVGCFISFGAAPLVAPVSGTFYPNALFIPPGVIITSAVLGPAASVIALKGAGTVVIQGIYKWASLGLTRQLTNL